MKSSFSLEGKTAIVTGGGKGIGEHISKVFANNGASVIILDLDAESAQKTAYEISKNGGRVEFYSCDVSNHAEVHEVIDLVIASHGKLDVLVNNAGIAQVGNVENTTLEDMQKIFDVNVVGVYNCLHAAIPHMKENNGGVVVNMASIASVIGLEDRFGYSMTKGAVLAMTYSVAKDYINDNIRCNAIGPARVHTPFVDGFIKKNYPGREEEMFANLSATQPIGRMGKPEEIAHLALYLCSDEANFITGSFYPIDGGFLTLNT